MNGKQAHRCSSQCVRDDISREKTSSPTHWAQVAVFHITSTPLLPPRPHNETDTSLGVCSLQFRSVATPSRYTPIETANVMASQPASQKGHTPAPHSSRPPSTLGLVQAKQCSTPHPLCTSTCSRPAIKPASLGLGHALAKQTVTPNPPTYSRTGRTAFQCPHRQCLP